MPRRIDEAEAIIGLDISTIEEYDGMGFDWDSPTPVDPIQSAEDDVFYDLWAYSQTK